MQILLRNGITLVLKNFRASLDSDGTGMNWSTLNFVTHAHGDHIGGVVNTESVMTDETARLIETLTNSHHRHRTINLNTPTRVEDGISVMAKDAGHVLGSCQYIFDTQEGNLTYTGDINIRDTIISKGAEIIESENLIIESTYGNPDFSFPERESTYADIVKWILATLRNGVIPAFRVYPLGKAQEVIRIVNTYLNVPVLTNYRVQKACEVYAQFGKRLSFIGADSNEGKEMLTTSNEYVFVSSSKFFPSVRNAAWAVATGWALRYRFSNYDAAFPLSGHSDFDGLLQYVEQAKPNKIHVVHGYSKMFASFLRRRGFDAAPLEERIYSTRLLDETFEGD